MGATAEGNRKTRQTNIERFGSEENYREHMRAIAARGGKSSVKKGFAVTNKQYNIGTFERADYDAMVRGENS